MKKSTLYLLAAAALVMTSIPVNAQQAVTITKEKPKLQNNQAVTPPAAKQAVKSNDGAPVTAPARANGVTEKVGPISVTTTPGSQANPQVVPPAPPVPLTCTWDITDYDFGKNVMQMKPASATFTITNAGKEPVTITLVQPSCGCTSPKYTKEPIKPGDKGEVVLTYDAKNSGYFSKSAQVKLNDGQKYMLTIKGDVQKVEGTPAAATTEVPQAVKK
jgi:hypothetical protein